MKRLDIHLWVSRLLIAIVVAWNLECALTFLLHPEAFAPSFELTGLPGQAAVRGFAILFIMWNVPYLVALWNPIRHRLSLWEALAMQMIGVIGESLIWFSIPAAHPVLRASLLKFMIFDGMGVLLLILSIWLVSRDLKVEKF